MQWEKSQQTCLTILLQVYTIQHHNSVVCRVFLLKLHTYLATDLQIKHTDHSLVQDN